MFKMNDMVRFESLIRSNVIFQRKVSSVPLFYLHFCATHRSNMQKKVPQYCINIWVLRWQWRGSLLPRPPACQKDFFDKLRALRRTAQCSFHKRRGLRSWAAALACNGSPARWRGRRVKRPHICVGAGKRRASATGQQLGIQRVQQAQMDAAEHVRPAADVLLSLIHI